MFPSSREGRPVGLHFGCILTSSEYTGPVRCNPCPACAQPADMLPVRELPILPLTLDGDPNTGQNWVPPQASMTNTTTHGTSIEEALSLWEASLRTDSTSEKEIRNKVAAVRYFAEADGWAVPADATFQSIDASKSAMVGKSSKTIRNQISRLAVFLDYCVGQGWIETNPARLVKPPKLVRGDGVRALSTEEVNRLIKAVPDRSPHRRLVYGAAAWTGLRQSELAQLRQKHVVLAGRPHLDLPASLTKSRMRQRVPLLDQAVPFLAATRTTGTMPDDLVFKMPDPQTFNRDLERAGIPKLDERGLRAGFHSLRKHLATALAQAGVDIYSAQELMRHADINTTRKYYMDDKFIEIGDKVRTAFSGGRESDRQDFFTVSGPIVLTGPGV